MNTGFFLTAVAAQVSTASQWATNALTRLQLKMAANQQIFDAVSNATGTIDSLTNGVKLICYAGAALSFAVGAGQYLTGGDEAMRKAKHRWIGAGVGLIVAVGVTVIRDYIKSKAQFK